MSKEFSQINIIEELKNYFFYLQELGINYIPATEELKRFLKLEISKEEGIESLKEKVLKCEKCPLSRIRKQPVWGEGSLTSGLLLITEYPDKDEDFYGRPFTGSVEDFLKRMLFAIKLRKEDFFITPSVKCKTPGGRPPEDEEISACRPYLFKQIKYLKPKLILAMGFTPVKSLLETKEPFSNIRGKVFKVKDIPVVFTYHPNYILKNPAVKRMVWEDLQVFRKLYEEIFKNT